MPDARSETYNPNEIGSFTALPVASDALFYVDSMS
jgi:hypothetical protein